MKIILSRKGFDAANGRIPSPILPDGTMLSLPIPEKNGDRTYSEISFGGRTYGQIIKELNSDFDEANCHLDPDLRDAITCRPAGWRPAFGQRGAALSHLRNNNVGAGDLFLFFGWFRMTELDEDKRLAFAGPNMHAIYGYMKVGSIIKGTRKIREEFPWHPHGVYKHEPEPELFPVEDDNNWLFVPDGDDWGTFKYAPKLVLTKEGMTRGKWDLPDFFKNVHISRHSEDCWQDDYFQSVSIGQEFIIDEPTADVINWSKGIIRAGGPGGKK